MCGIVGYVGKSQAAPILLDGLSKLEYRGYDSAGMAVYDGKKIEFEKAKGRLRLLSEKTHDGDGVLPCGNGGVRRAMRRHDKGWRALQARSRRRQLLLSRTCRPGEVEDGKAEG